MRTRYFTTLLLLVGLCGCGAFAPSGRQIVISANDNRLDLAYGAMRVYDDPRPDTLTVLDFATFPPTVTNVGNVPNTVIGPPTNVAITPDQRLALVANSLIIDPNDSTKQIPDTKIAIIDLTVDPPAKIGEVEAGAQPSGISITPDGDLALVANRADGSVSVLSLSGREVEHLEKVTIGEEGFGAEAGSGVAHVAITPDGKTALASKQNENSVALLKIDGRKVTYTGRDMTVGLTPYSLDISADGETAIVATGGAPTGDTSAAAIIDLTLSPPRVVNHAAIGFGPEHLVFSPDGKLAAAAIMNGSNAPRDNGFRTETGLVRLFRRKGHDLIFCDEKPCGAVPEGVAFTNDGKYVIVQNYVDRSLSIFRVTWFGLQKACDDIPVTGQPSAIRAATRGRS